MLTKKAQPPSTPFWGLRRQAIETGEYSRARQLLKESMANDMENPERIICSGSVMKKRAIY